MTSRWPAVAASSVVVAALLGCGPIIYGVIEASRTPPDPPFRLISVSPAGDAMGVDPNTTIRFVFSAPIDEASIGPGALQVEYSLGLHQYADVQGFIRTHGRDVSVPENEVRFEPAGRLVLNADILATLSATIRSRSGSQLGAISFTKFSTRPGQWTTPLSIFLENTPNIVAVRTYDSGDLQAIVVASGIGSGPIVCYPVAKSGLWGTPITIMGDNTPLGEISVSVSRVGCGVLAAEVGGPGEREIWVSTCCGSSAAWTALERIDSGILGNSPRAVMTQFTRSVVTWTSPSNEGIYSSWNVGAGGWQPALRLDGATATAVDSGVLAANGNGSAVAVWRQAGTGAFQGRTKAVAYRRFTPFGWDVAPAIAYEASAPFPTELSLACTDTEAGMYSLVWNENGRIALLTYQSVKDTWSTNASIIDNVGMCCSHSPVLTAGVTNASVISWIGTESSFPYRETTKVRRMVSGVLFTGFELDSGNFFAAQHARFGFDGAGGMLAVWDQLTEDDISRQVWYRSLGAIHSTLPQQLFAQQPMVDPHCAVMYDGKAFVVAGLTDQPLGTFQYAFYQ